MHIGFSETRLVDAAREQMERLPTYHLFGGKSHRPAIELAERLLAMAPVPMSVLFTSSGSEANDTAIKLVRYYHHAIGKPDKRKIIARERASPWRHLAGASLSGLPHVHRDFGLPLEGFCTPDARTTSPCAAGRDRGVVRASRCGAGAYDPPRGAGHRRHSSSSR